ncbi:MAG: DUF2470 domain-containing protein [Polyangiaceae bacterium]|nr:DUF2470 domain-containing protein [Polyangiaceae bacterium]
MVDAAARAPSHAERCRTLAARAAFGTLCTVLSDPPGYPFGSLTATCVDEQGRPLFLLSELAEHTRNLHTNPNASLLLTEADAPGGAADPLARARVTLVGHCERVGEEGGAREARAAFLAHHPSAGTYAAFKDFAIYRLTPLKIRYVGGFGRMSWVTAEQYLAAQADPLAPSAASIIEHMNGDHPDALLAYARAFAGVADPSRALMVSIDRYGFELCIVSPEGDTRSRISFREDITSPDAARRALVALVKEARSQS